MDLRIFFKQWRFTLILIGAVVFGALLGTALGPQARSLKFLGDILLNLLFTAVVPLIFFSLSSALASASSLKRLGRIGIVMLLVFIITGVIASCVMLVAVKLVPPTACISAPPPMPVQPQPFTDLLVRTITVPNFVDLLSRGSILALIIFSLLVGLASQLAGEKGAAFRQVLVSGSEVMGRLIRLIMLYAPIGLAGYFAFLAGEYGDQLFGSYARAVGVYYPVALLYFALAFTLYVYAAAGRQGIRLFWTHIPPAALTAWGTSSSLAALPVNLEAARRIGVPEDIRETVLPIGATIHMDGSCLAAILKIAMLFSIYGRPFDGPAVYLGAIGAALLCGIVMSGIPGGGFLGETLIVTLYGFPLEALPIISMLGTLVDPPATMINSAGDTAAAMLVHRFTKQNL
ncbi:MAG: dicarboxylate/amino acid:cation symporter [Planctomycetaceae bacterium]|nr:dicarboxylate/amino acid:cation symporter [Planctomycetaceae bacterium]